MALVEDSWFTERLRRPGLPAPWADVDWDADRDWELPQRRPTTPPSSSWRSTPSRAQRSRAVVAAASSLDERSVATSPESGEPCTLRWILVHMIEETARHNGHVDLLRESIDGLTGE